MIYETATGTIKTKIDGKGFTAFSFSPDGTFVVAQNSSNDSLDIFETETGKKIREIRGLDKVSNLKKSFNNSETFSLEMGQAPISPDWKNILINKNDNEFLLHDFASGEFKFELKHNNFNTSWETTKVILMALGGGANLLQSFSDAQFNSDSKYIVIANGNKKPTLWSVETGKLTATLDSPTRIYRTKFSPNGKMVATSDLNGVTKVWNVETGNIISTFGSKKDRTLVSIWSFDSEKIISISFNKKNDVRVYEALSGKTLYQFEKSDSPGVIPSENSRFIVTIPKKDKSILFQIWETDTGKLLATIPRKKGENSLVSLKWSPDNQLIATANALRNDIQLWNLNGEHLQTLPNTTFPMKFSDDGKLLATGGKTTDPKNDIGYIWDLKSKQ